MTPKEEFISIYTENIKRGGADKLLEKRLLYRPEQYPLSWIV